MRKDNRLILHRLRQAIKEKGMSPRAASLEAGLGPDVIRDLERKPDTMPTIDTVQALAVVLDKTPEFLAFGSRGDTRPHFIPIIGEVAAGLWLDLNAAEDREYDNHPAPFHPSYAEEGQYGLIVIGTSINNVAQPGDVLQCLDVAISGMEPQDGDLVIVERRRAQAGQKEVTAKRYRKRGKVDEMTPDSTDPRWKEPLIFDPKKATGDEEVAIIAVVIGVYKPMRRK